MLKIYRNAKALQNAIDNADRIPGMLDLLEDYEKTEHENVMEMYYCEPYWIDYYNMPIHDDTDMDDIVLEYCPGYYCSPVGTIRPDTGMVLAGTLEAPKEIEIQADDGECAYHYLGEGFYEVWVQKKDFTGEVKQ